MKTVKLVACSIRMSHCEKCSKSAESLALNQASNQMRTADNHFLHKLQFSLFSDVSAILHNNAKKHTHTISTRNGENFFFWISCKIPY